MNDFKPGSRVRLKKDFYNLNEFKMMNRNMRKDIASSKDSIGIYIDTNERGFVSCNIAGYMIPTALLEPVETVKPVTSRPVFEAGKRYVYRDRLNENGGSSWSRKCDGREVTLTPDIARGKIDCFMICREWCEEITTLHSYTPEQIAEARDIVYRLMMGCVTGLIRLKSMPRDLRTYAILFQCGSTTYSETARAVAYCQPNDVWNDDIGRLVSLCKLLNEPLPAWVKGGAK